MLQRRLAHGQPDALGQRGRLVVRDAGRQHDELIAAEAGGRVAAADVRVDALSGFAQRHVTGEMTVLIVDLLEPIQVDEQAGQARALPLRARQLLLQARIQIAAVVPAGEEVREPAAHQARAIDRVLDRERSDDAEMREEIGRKVPREALLVGAAEIEAALQPVLAPQRNQRDAANAGAAGNSS